MEEEETPVSESVKTLRAAGAAVGQSVGTLDAKCNGQKIEADTDREVRVADLRRRYTEGSYQVNAADVASRVVDDHLT